MMWRGIKDVPDREIVAAIQQYGVIDLVALREAKRRGLPVAYKWGMS